MLIVVLRFSCAWGHLEYSFNMQSAGPVSQRFRVPRSEVGWGAQDSEFLTSTWVILDL